MSPAEVADALLVSESLVRVGGPYEQEDFPGGVKASYDAGKLARVALDAVTGPQVFLAGFPLAGSDPGQVGKARLTRPLFVNMRHGLNPVCGPEGEASGVLLRAGEIGTGWSWPAHVASRPGTTGNWPNGRRASPQPSTSTAH